jgi:hypothetical protein
VIHYVYLGHFDKEADFIRFERHADTKPAWYRPVVVQSLDQSVVADLLAEKGLTPSTLPDDWGIAFDQEGFVVCDRFTRNRDAQEFVNNLASRTGCDVADFSSLSLVSAEQLWPKDSLDDSAKGKQRAVI